MTIFFNHSNSASIVKFCNLASNVGYGSSMIEGLCVSFLTRCQISSVINGMIGCKRRKIFSNTNISVWRVPDNASALLLSEVKIGFDNSKYQSQNSFQVNSYNVCAYK